MSDWLKCFFDTQKRMKGKGCTCCSDCDNERKAAAKEIRRLRKLVAALGGKT